MYVEEGGVEFVHEFGALALVPLIEPAAVFGLETAAGQVACLGKRQHIDRRAGDVAVKTLGIGLRNRLKPRTAAVVSMGSAWYNCC